MSHYAVGVFHRPDQSVDDLLAPFNENMEVEPYVEFTRQQAIDYVRRNFEKMKDASDQECYDFIADDYKKDEDGNLLSTYNKNSKWDWYIRGGRFGGSLKLKSEAVKRNNGFESADEARLKDIDFSPDKEAFKRAARFWEVYVEGKPTKADEDPASFDSFWKPEYYLNRYQTKENFANCHSSFRVYACVTPDGEWHAPGDMGWWGMSNETPEDGLDWDLHFKERFIDGADENLILTIVDCHI